MKKRITDKRELLLYEVPSITEYISNDFLQEIIAKYIAYKVNKKYKRYEERCIREDFFNPIN